MPIQTHLLCNTDLFSAEVDALVLGVAAQNGLELPSDCPALTQALHARQEIGDLCSNLGSTQVLYHVEGIKAQRIVLVGLGEAEKFDETAFIKAIQSLGSALEDCRVRHVSLAIDSWPLARPMDWKIRQVVQLLSQQQYRLETYREEPANPSAFKLEAITFSAPSGDVNALQAVLLEAEAVWIGAQLSRDLANAPANICTPSYLAEQAVQLAQQYPDSLKLDVLEQPQLEEMGFGAFLSVAQGSQQPPKLIALHHQGADSSQAPYILVGKGITFDTGGISLKPPADMDEMKFDMCGAATVLGTLAAIAKLKIKLNVIAIVPTCENMPSDRATRPGDIVRSLSGKTIEIQNTDAEGRLILCDALSYAQTLNPKLIIDVATLTGACVIALGHQAHGLFSNDDTLAQDLLSAGEESWDRGWQLPLWKEYREQLKSPFADLNNIGGRAAGTVTAACFLSHFVGEHPWAHLDIAGTAWLSGKKKCSTARPVPMLVRYLAHQASIAKT